MICPILPKHSANVPASREWIRLGGISKAREGAIIKYVRADTHMAVRTVNRPVSTTS
jgi:hypothetical protein